MTARPASHAASLAAVAHANARTEGLPYRSEWIGGSRGSTHPVTAGTGPTVVFVHGFPSFWYCWIRQMEALRGSHRVMAVDAPGAGASDVPGHAEQCRIDSLVAWLGEVIEDVAPAEKVMLVGHDWGAALAFALAQARPELVSGVVGIAAPPYSQFIRLLAEDPQQQARSAYMHRLRLMEPSRAAEIAPELAQAAYAGLLAKDAISLQEAELFDAACGDPSALLAGCAWYRANLGSDPGAIEPVAWPAGKNALVPPALLIWGGGDQTFVDQAPDCFASDNPGAQVLRLAGIGHWCMLEAPDAVTSAIIGHELCPSQEPRR